MPHLTPGRDTLPTALRRNATWVRIGDADVPAMVVHPHAERRSDAAQPPPPVPLVLWFHGRTANKELDAGRYLRWMRAGLGVCAIDLPGHGERSDEALQRAEATLEVVERMVEEIDGVVTAFGAALGAEQQDRASPLSGFDTDRIAIGGMSAGGMVTLARLCRPHAFTCATVEATTGSWRWQGHRAMHHPTLSERLNPITHLARWRPIPLLAIHARHDEWVAFEGQQEFLDALRELHLQGGADPDDIELLAFERTGAAHEHLGFGRHAAEAKDRQTEFLVRRLLAE